MKFHVPTILFLTLLASSFHIGSVNAGQNGKAHRLIEIPIAELVEVGDIQPFWETSISIRQHQLSRSSYAAIEFVSADVWDRASNNLIVNGRAYVLPSDDVGIGDLPNRGKTAIPVPLGLLRKGQNTIAIQAGAIDDPTNQYDDFVLANIVLVLSR